jgi:hypothetical protein
MNKSMGLVGMARQGRGGDTTMAHMTPGEKVIPKEVAAMRPDLVAHVANAIKQYGGDPRKYTVGAGRVNPRTGAEEFASEFEIQNAYKATLGRDASSEDLAYWGNDANNFQGGGFNTAAARELAARPAPTPAPEKPWYEAATDNYRAVINKNFTDTGKEAYFSDTTTKLGGFDTNPLTNANAKWVGPRQDDMVNPYYKPGGAGYGFVQESEAKILPVVQKAKAAGLAGQVYDPRFTTTNAQAAAGTQAMRANPGAVSGYTAADTAKAAEMAATANKQAPNREAVGADAASAPSPDGRVADTGPQKMSKDSGLVGTVNPNVLDWYRNATGRDADQGGAKYWTNISAQIGEAAAYEEFKKALQANEGAGGYVKNITLDAANADWTGPTNQDHDSIVDEWASNVFGRDATAEEIAKYDAMLTDPTAAAAAYAKFVASGTGGNRTLTMLQASQLPYKKITDDKKVVVDDKKKTTDEEDNSIDTLEELGGTRLVASDYGNLVKENPRDTSRVVTDDMTIQGRLNDVLGQDASGNYTNQVVRQAVERAQQQFAKRGLVNSSMAAQAGQEAAIAKAIEIVGPDAERFFQQGRANQDARNVFARDEIQQAYGERNNQNQWQHDANMQSQRISADAALQNQRVQSDANLQTQRIVADATGRHEDFDFRTTQLEREQAFNLRANYITAQDRVSQSYQRMVDTINTSQMKPEDKTAALENAATIRDTEAAFINNLFAKQPNWSNEWLAMAAQPGTADLSTSTDVNVLATLANDPAQTSEVRQKAQTRLAQLQADPSLVPPTPTPTPAPNGGGLADYTGSGN